MKFLCSTNNKICNLKLILLAGIAGIMIYIGILYLINNFSMNWLSYVLKTVECSGDMSKDINYNCTVSNLSEVDKLPKASKEINDSSAMISEGLKTVGDSISKLAPALAGIGAGAGTAKIFKNLPPAQRAGSIVAAGTLAGGVTLLSQVIAKFPNVEASSNTLNSKQENVSSPPDFNVNSPFELEIGSLEEGLTLAIVIFTVGAYYAVFTVLFNLLARSFNLESRPFITSRPKLAKWVSYVLIGHSWCSILTLFLAWLCLLGILFTSLYLLSLY